MSGRGRKAASDYIAVSEHAPVQLHLPPPAKLTQEERKLWIDTVRSRPVQWFRPEHEPLLVEYVRAVSMADKLAVRLHKAKGADELMQLQRAVALVQRSIITFARSMRLTHQSIPADLARTKVKSVNGEETAPRPSKRPWEH